MLEYQSSSPAQPPTFYLIRITCLENHWFAAMGISAINYFSFAQYLFAQQFLRPKVKEECKETNSLRLPLPGPAHRPETYNNGAEHLMNFQ